jgi:hypothetical protein
MAVIVAATPSILRDKQQIRDCSDSAPSIERHFLEIEEL